ncbi:hypothetical protein KVH31_34820 [Streptomyces olivaceus]|uniref:hypothetical protein n=1 Tax=Streptomyces olivaceus TaxID=47716 RepID=UPI0006B67421|nr:hypothetical protein [Streptomyces olivaceus]KPC69085.1 hypothetical protein ADL27_54990 [Streptomyces sp. NRRL F-6602]MBZ6211672.1 hypothetical protein [Streptomyces olivaceus]
MNPDLNPDWVDTTLTPAGQALYLSELPTDDLVTPHDVRLIRDQAVTELGFDGLRRAQLIAALRNAVLISDGHDARHHWARTTTRFADPEGLL